ncbi:SPOR domain-containing protein [Bacillus sp. M6-12]
MWYPVFTGPFASKADAEAGAAKLKKEFGYLTYVKEE